MNYLVENPVFVEYTAANTLPVTLVVSKSSGGEIYRSQAFANNTGKISWNIADILKPHIGKTLLDDTEVLQHIAPFLYNLSLEIDDAVVLIKNYNAVFPGGIPKHQFRKLAAADTDIFAEKLQNYTDNCFLTTRTAGDIMVLPSSEVGFLYCVGDNSTHTLTIINTDGNQTYTINIPAGVLINAISLSYVLCDMELQKGIFDIKIDGNLCLTIEVTEPAPSNERYILNFRNSWGMYELIEVTGRAISEPEYGEETVYAIYDKITDSLRNEKLRKEATEVIKAECGYRSRERLLFIRDMLQSEDVKLYGADGEWFDVLVSTDGDKIALNMAEPVSIPLTITMCEAEKLYSAEERISLKPNVCLKDDLSNFITTNNNKKIILDYGN